MKRLGFIGADNPVGTDLEDSAEISIVNRMRFDPFASDFDTDTAWAAIKSVLEKKNYVSLAFHAQNALRSTFPMDVYKKNADTLKQFVLLLRQHYKHNVVFLTSGELHQIKQRGWSMEVWSDHFICRNYNQRSIRITVPNLKEKYWHGESWTGRDLKLSLISSSEDEDDTSSQSKYKHRRHSGYVEKTEVGSEVELLPMSTYEIALM